MPKSKQRKGHKKKVAARKKRILEEKKKAEKMQKQFLMDMIKREQEKGAFDNTESVDVSGSKTDIDSTQGPQI